MFLSNFKKLFFSKEFGIIYSDNMIYIIPSFPFGTDYFKTEEVIYECQREETDTKDILTFLSLKKDLPEKISSFIQDRFDIVGRSYKMYSGDNPDNKNNAYFRAPKKLLKSISSMYGIDNPQKIKLTIVDTFDNKDDFDSSKEEGFVYSLWEIEDNNVSSSFTFNHPLLTKVCFPDFGSSELNKGSLFVKMKKEFI